MTLTTSTTSEPAADTTAEPVAAVSNIQRRTEAATTPAKQSLTEFVRGAIEKQAPRFQAILPAGFDHARFHNLVLAAVKKKPDLMECFKTNTGQISVLLAAMEAAAVGLEPDTPMQEAWLLPRRNKGVMECQLSIGYQGLVKLARRSGEIKTIKAVVVRQGDEFTYSYGLDADVLDHTPAPSDARGDLTHVWARVRYINGGVDFVVLDKGEVEARRARSDSYKSEKSRPYSPWVTATAAMWQKSSLRELAKLMPKSAEYARIEQHDERTLGFDDDGDIAPTDITDAEEVIDAELVD